MRHRSFVIRLLRDVRYRSFVIRLRRDVRYRSFVIRLRRDVRYRSFVYTSTSRRETHGRLFIERVKEATHAPSTNCPRDFYTLLVTHLGKSLWDIRFNKRKIGEHNATPVVPPIDRNDRKIE